MEGANEEIRELSYANARKLYGEDLPQIVIDRLEKLKVLSVMDLR